MNEIYEKVRFGCTKRNLFAASLLILVLAVTAGLVTQSVVVADSTSPNHDPLIASAQETSKAFTAVTKRVAPAVVFIKATKQPVLTGQMQQFGDLRGQIPDDMLKRFFGDVLPPMQMPRQSQPMVGQGSGFIISDDGYILTNNHVAGEADKLEVTLSDGRVLDAKLIGTDARTDLAIIKIDAKDLPLLRMGDSDKIEVGEWVLAVGSPFGLAGTVTSGIVSAKGRTSMGITDYEDFIQTDAAINPGNSGGPLVNLQGEAVGINTAIISRSGGYNGIGFAIPMNMAKDICDQLIKNGSVVRGYLGVMIQPLTPELAQSFNVKDTRGVLIGDLTPDSPAAEAGLQRGDVVVQLDGKPVEDLTSFRNHIAAMKPGTKANLVVLRGGAQEELVVSIGTLPDQEVAASHSEGAVKSLGLSVQTLNQQLADQLGVSADSGVVITEVVPGSVADSQGLRPGMIIKQVDKQLVKNAGQFSELIKGSKDSTSHLLLVQDGDHTRYVVLKVEK